MMSKEEVEKHLNSIQALIEEGTIQKNDINQIAMDRMEEYIERFEKVKEIERRLKGVIQLINEFGSHNRISILSEVIIDLNRGIPIEPNARIGILENVKQFIFEDAKAVCLPFKPTQ